MQENKEYSIDMELTTPEKLTLNMRLRPEEVFSYNTSRSKLLVIPSHTHSHFGR
jgi:hypothetical protein